MWSWNREGLESGAQDSKFRHLSVPPCMVFPVPEGLSSDPESFFQDHNKPTKTLLAPAP